MPLPLAPIAGLALRYGAVALAGYALARSLPRGRIDQRAEDALDEMDEGVAFVRPADRPGQTNAAARLRRVIRVGATGPAWEVEAAGFCRVRIRKAT
ncbi:MAG: hypothetical protein H5U20_02915 [Rhodobacteraceae bacterium]|nr:hypothetical protein [Paracoccaceae bacterium]